MWAIRLATALARTSLVLLALAVTGGGLLRTAQGADQFGDVVISLLPTEAGETSHGYRECRFRVENLAPDRGHVVTLTFPRAGYGYGGESLRSVSRTVTVGPLARVTIPVWQPPLPINGNTTVRVFVDGDEADQVSMTVPTRHASRLGYHHGSPPEGPAMLVSRSLNADDLSAVLKAQGASRLTAALAVGMPSRPYRPGAPSPHFWMPDPGGGAHWIELDYDPPLIASQVRIYQPRPEPLASGDLVLIGASGTNLLTVPLSHGIMQTSPDARHEFSFPLTSEPVKMVRLTFAGHLMSVDAVELAGSGGSGWASAARASSEAPSAVFGSALNPGECRLLRSELPVSQWSDRWLSYTPYDAVLIASGDPEQMPPAVLGAITAYMECGGNVVVIGGQPPSAWRSGRRGKLQYSDATHLGFGNCLHVPDTRIKQWPEATIKAILNTAQDTRGYWANLPDAQSANAAFPVIANYRVPVRTTALIMLAFVLVIGPVNLVVLHRMKRRIWLLWTVPAISAATCAAVFAFSLLREGITPTVRMTGVTLLDQQQHRSATIGMTALYCPLTPNQGLFFGFDTEATPLLEARSYYRSRGGGAQREVDWTESQRLVHGWVTARVPAHFHLRKSETRRERLQFSIVDDQPLIVNGLGAPIRSLWLADAAGRVYSAADVPAGETARLGPCAEMPELTEQSGPDGLLARISYNPTTNLINLTHPGRHLVAGSYVAELEGNPFLENPLGPKASSARTRSHSIVYGLLESQ